jgi:hypothetical protein
MSLDTSPSEKRKSFALATLIYAVLLVLLFFIRFWPPSDEELAALAGGGGGGGVEVNFGDTDFGSGNNYQSQELNVKNDTKTTTSSSAEQENIITQDDNADATDAVIPKNDIKVPKPVVVKDPKPVVPEKPKVNTSANSALANIIKGPKKGGDGNSSSQGNQGSANGNINSTGYGQGGSGGGTGGGHGTGNGTGNGPGSGSGSGGGNGSGNGLGNGSGYALTGRKALTKPSPVYNCNEEGVVVVQITVDKNGNVVDAKPGARGTTNPATCLASQARIAAMNTKWSASLDGTEKQVGTIRYNFSLKD